MRYLVLAKNRDKTSVGWDSLTPSLQTKVLERLKEAETPKYLDSGSRGTIYSLEDGNLVKITDDEGEADVAEIIHATPHNNLYKVFDVFQIGETEPEIYGIKQEKLEPADPEWFKFGNIFNKWHTDMTNKIRDKEGDDEKTIYLLPPIVEIFFKYLDRLNGKGSFEEQRTWLMELSEYFKENGILYLDIHGGNIMKRPEDDHHVLIDLGYSESPEVELPVVLGNFNRMEAVKIILLGSFYLFSK